MGGAWTDSANFYYSDTPFEETESGSAPDGSSVFAVEWREAQVDFGSGIINNLAYYCHFVRAYDPWGNLKWDKIIMGVEYSALAWSGCLARWKQLLERGTTTQALSRLTECPSQPLAPV